MKENKKEALKQMSEQELNAYLLMYDEDTPNLWNRIEAGFEEEINATDEHVQYNSRLVSVNRRVKRLRVAIAIAATVLVTIIAVPVILFSNMRMGNKSASDTYNIRNEKNDMEYGEETGGEQYDNYNNQVQDAEMAESVSEDDYEHIIVTEAGGMTENEIYSETAGVTDDETDTSSADVKNQSDGQQEKTVFEEFIFRYKKSLKVLKKFM